MPLAPNAGENVTLMVQLAPAASCRLAAHFTVPLPAAANSPLAVIVFRVTVFALTFFTVTVLAALVVPTASRANVMVAGVKVSGGVVPPEPVPESATSWVLNEVLSLTVRPPLIAPFAVGEKVIAMLHFALEAREAAQVVPVELTA